MECIFCEWQPPATALALPHLVGVTLFSFCIQQILLQQCFNNALLCNTLFTSGPGPAGVNVTPSVVTRPVPGSGAPCLCDGELVTCHGGGALRDIVSGLTPVQTGAVQGSCNSRGNYHLLIAGAGFVTSWHRDIITSCHEPLHPS